MINNSTVGYIFANLYNLHLPKVFAEMKLAVVLWPQFI